MLYFLILLFIFILIILVRTFLFKPSVKEERKIGEINFNSEEVISNLQQLIKCKTISYNDSKLENDEEFDKLINLLPTLYPNVYKNTELKTFDGRALLFRWKGRMSNDPAVFMAHYDVVPVDEENWTKPAFEGLIEDDVMWGRGTLDTKVTFNGILSAGEYLIKNNFIPENDIYFAFSGGEEISGPGAINIVNYFKENNITPSFVLDEGGAVVSDVFPGLNTPCALVGVAEKGFYNMTLTINSNGGHASAPSKHTPIGELSKACRKIENNPFPMHITKPVQEMFNELGRRSTFIYRVLFANLWCFSWILNIYCKKVGGQINALVRTTCAFTQMSGSDAPNVIPPTASMTANIRVNPNDNVESTVNRFKSLINNDKISISISDVDEPSRISTTACDGYMWIKSAIEDTWRGCVAAPYLMVQCSDSRHYGIISDKVYRFSATDLTDEEIESIHGNDEHIRLETINKSVEFFIRLMKKC